MRTLDIIDMLSPIDPFTMPAAGVARFHLHDMATAERLAVIDAALRTFDLSTLSLGAGQITLGLAYEDQYGSRSLVGITATGTTSDGTLTIAIDGDGAIIPQLIVPTPISALPAESGMVALTWQSIDYTKQQLAPSAWEIADAADLGTILATITARRRSRADAEVGPYGDGQTVRLVIRSSDGVMDGARSPWAAFAPVVTDASAPPVPEVVT